VADAAGNLLIADTGNLRVRMVAATSGTFYGQPMTAGDIYTIAGNGYTSFSGNGVPARNAELQDPAGLAADASGDTVIADLSNDRIRFIAGTSGTRFGRPMTAGDIYTIAGNGKQGYSGCGCPGTASKLGDPNGPAIDGAGNVPFADTSTNYVQVVAAVSGTFYGQPMTAGHLYTIAGNGTAGYSGDGGPATSAELNHPKGVAVDAQGNVLINDAGNARIRVVAATSGTFYGQAMTAGDIYTIAGDGTAGYSGDGGPATAAELSGYSEPAVDQAGNVIIADGGNNRVRVIAAASGTFYGQAMTAGDIYTIAAGLSDPYEVAVDRAGNVIIADSGDNRVLVYAAVSGTFYGQAMTAGDIYSIAGNYFTEYFDYCGVANPTGVAVDSAGNVLFSDSGNNLVREVAAVPPGPSSGCP
jgi:trimeric autotransporter adhesin